MAEREPAGDGAGSAGDEGGVRAELEAAKQRLEELERDRAIDAELIAQRPVDLEAARLLLREALRGKPASEAAGAAAQMRRRRPWLFEPGGGGSGPGVGGAPVMGAASEPEGIARLAESARASGDSRALMRYLRARRGR